MGYQLMWYELYLGPEMVWFYLSPRHFLTRFPILHLAMVITDCVFLTLRKFRRMMLMDLHHCLESKLSNDYVSIPRNVIWIIVIYLS